MTSPTFVGIDVAKDKLDIAVRPSAEQWVTPQTEEGLSALVATLAALAPELVVLEATGGYEAAAAAALITAGVPVAVANPRQVRQFARGIGQLAKTDRLDAHILAILPRRCDRHPARCPMSRLSSSRTTVSLSWNLLKSAMRVAARTAFLGRWYS